MLKKTAKIIMVTIVVVAVSVAVLTVLSAMLDAVFGPLGAPTQRLKEMELDFRMNQGDLIIVRDFLTASEYERISIRNEHSSRSGQVQTNDFEMFLPGYFMWVLVEDEIVQDSLRNLFNNGYRNVSKDGNVIDFLRWTGLDRGRGLAYSIDGTTPEPGSPLDFLIAIMPMSEEGWFFYIEDFDEHRQRRRQEQRSNYEQNP